MLILSINRGSSSLKFALYEIGQKESLVLKGELERTGASSSHFKATGPDGAILHEDQLSWSATETSRIVADWLKSQTVLSELAGIGHRIVQGGQHFVNPQIIAPPVLDALNELVPLAPEHLPVELETIKSIGQAFPKIPQVACFDTAFHRRMPLVAQTYALPQEEGVIRYGFHGLSYEFILGELRQLGHKFTGRVIVAHLGNGCSMAAIREGVGIDTTMGFTPAGGLVMGTRCGDIDPGAIVYLVRKMKLDPAALNDLVNKKSGLLGVSGISSDMRDLLAQEHDNQRAELAVDLFCYQARKFLGSLAAALGGIDKLVFTGGIGENASEIRRRICDGLQFLGIQIDTERNTTNAKVISLDNCPVVVHVLKTNEELMIARHTCQVLATTK
jgi:acetate kinase